MMGSRCWIIFLVLCARGTLGHWLDEDYFASFEVEEEFEEDIDEAKLRLYEDAAHAYAPYLRFHKTEGNEGFCFPHNASEYYDHRVAGDWSRLCNENYDSVRNNEIPTYWHALECSDHLHIAYWNFYGYNHDCDCCSGERDAWWEFVVVKIRDFESDHSHLSEVMFGQKKGWYTRVFSHYEVFNETHPVAYVGRASHGFYHDDGGSNTCCYYEDTRNPGDADQHMMTWNNLVRMTQGNGEAWMTDPNTDYWNGLEVPTFRKDWYLCNLVGCDGSFFWGCGKSGCAKSDIGDDPF